MEQKVPKATRRSEAYTAEQADELLELFPEADHIRQRANQSGKVNNDLFQETFDYLAKLLGSNQAVVKEFLKRRSRRKHNREAINAANTAEKKKQPKRFSEDKTRALAYPEELKKSGHKSNDQVRALSKGLLSSTERNASPRREMRSPASTSRKPDIATREEQLRISSPTRHPRSRSPRRSSRSASDHLRSASNHSRSNSHHSRSRSPSKPPMAPSSRSRSPQRKKSVQSSDRSGQVSYDSKAFRRSRPKPQYHKPTPTRETQEETISTTEYIKNQVQTFLFGGSATQKTPKKSILKNTSRYAGGGKKVSYADNVNNEKQRQETQAGGLHANLNAEATIRDSPSQRKPKLTPSLAAKPKYQPKPNPYERFADTTTVQSENSNTYRQNLTRQSFYSAKRNKHEVEAEVQALDRISNGHFNPASQKSTNKIIRTTSSTSTDVINNVSTRARIAAFQPIVELSSSESSSSGFAEHQLQSQHEFEDLNATDVSGEYDRSRVSKQSESMDSEILEPSHDKKKSPAGRPQIIPPDHHLFPPSREDSVSPGLEIVFVEPPMTIAPDPSPIIQAMSSDSHEDALEGAACVESPKEEHMSNILESKSSDSTPEIMAIQQQPQWKQTTDCCEVVEPPVTIAPNRSPVIQAVSSNSHKDAPEEAACVGSPKKECMSNILETKSSNLTPKTMAIQQPQWKQTTNCCRAEMTASPLQEPKQKLSVNHGAYGAYKGLTTSDFIVQPILSRSHLKSGETIASLIESLKVKQDGLSGRPHVINETVRYDPPACALSSSGKIRLVVDPEDDSSVRDESNLSPTDLSSSAVSLSSNSSKNGPSNRSHTGCPALPSVEGSASSRSQTRNSNRHDEAIGLKPRVEARKSEEAVDPWSDSEGAEPFLRTASSGDDMPSRKEQLFSSSHASRVKTPSSKAAHTIKSQNRDVKLRGRYGEGSSFPYSATSLDIRAGQKSNSKVKGESKNDRKLELSRSLGSYSTWATNDHCSEYFGVQSCETSSAVTDGQRASIPDDLVSTSSECSESTAFEEIIARCKNKLEAIM